MPSQMRASTTSAAARDTVKAGVVLLILAAAYVFDRLRGQGPIRQLGRTSFPIYWVHLEIAYGNHVVPGARGNLPLGQAVFAVAILMLAMLAFSYARTARWKFLRSREALAKADR